MNVQPLADLQAYVEEHTEELIAPAFIGFPSAQVVEHDPMNKGKHTVQVGQVDSEIVGPWKELSYSDAEENATLLPVQLETVRGQFKWKFVPEKLEKSYLGFMRRTGQDPEDFPIEAFMLDLLTKQIAKDNERAFWKAKQIANPTKLSEMFDGLLTQVENAVAAGNLTVVTLGELWVPRSPEATPPAGSTDIIDAVDALVHALPEDVQEEGVTVYMSAVNKRRYELAKRNRFGASTSDLRVGSTDKTSMSGDVDPVGVPGLNGSNRMIATPMRNTRYSYDAPEDASTFNSDRQMNQMYYYGAYRFGSKFLMLNNEWMSVNELT